MCLIAFSLGQHPDYPLVVAANRDEFFHRPTVPMQWWKSELATTQLLAGRDQLSGGTWLAVSRQGEVSAVTNVREPGAATGNTTRGELPLLALSLGEQELEHRLRKNRDQYAGFNLVCLASDNSQPMGWYFSNRDPHPGRRVHRGIYGLSNHLLQTPWPKLLRLRNNMSRTLERASGHSPERLHQELIELLCDSSPPPDQDLPDTGVGLETERFLSAPFVVGEDYGTRATTVITLSRTGEIRVTEQNWAPRARPTDKQQFCWQRTE